MPESLVDHEIFEDMIRILETLTRSLKLLTLDPHCLICGISKTAAEVNGHFWTEDSVCANCEPNGLTRRQHHQLVSKSHG